MEEFSKSDLFQIKMFLKKYKGALLASGKHVVCQVPYDKQAEFLTEMETQGFYLVDDADGIYSFSKNLSEGQSFKVKKKN